MAIDPTTPLTPIIPAVPAGAAPDSVALLQAMARQALANTTAQLAEIAGRPAASLPKTDKPVEQAGQASTQDAGHAADAPTSKAAPGAAQPSPTRPAPETRMARAVRAAAAEAVPRQTGLAPLMADVRAVVERPGAPAEVREAGKALLARTPQAAEIATPQGLRRAVERSGLFLEARMAQAAAAPAPTETAPRVVDARDMKAALLVFRGALSAWLARAAPLSPDERPISAFERPDNPIASEAPEGDRQTVRAYAASPAPAPRSGQPASAPGDSPVVGPEAAAGEAEPTAEALPQPADDPSPIPKRDAPSTVNSAAPAPPRPEEETIEPRFASFLAPPRSPSAPAPAERAALPAVVQLGLMEEEGAVPPPETLPQSDPKSLVARGYGTAQAEMRSKVPPPPYAGGPMAGQKPTAPELPVDLSTADVVRRLLKGTNGALARQDLMQIASLPEPPHHETEVPEARHAGARLNLDLPFITPQGVAVAQFEIGHDGGGAGGGAAGPAERTYRARFSIDVEPLGPVHALVTLTGARARVSLWAERAETIARLRAGEESLGAALRQAELTPEVAVHSGAPPTPGVSALGHFVDQAS